MNIGGNDSKAWYALQVRARQEQKVASALEFKGYETFAPTYCSSRKTATKTRRVELALFPGYIFSRFVAENRLPLITVPGVITILGFGNGLVPVAAEEIDAIRRAVSCGLQTEPFPVLKTGQKVSVNTGPLTGVEGVLASFKGTNRLIVTITLLNRSIAIEVEENWVAPVDYKENTLETNRSPGVDLYRQKLPAIAPQMSLAGGVPPVTFEPDFL